MSFVVWAEFADRALAAVLLLRRRRQPGADAQPLSDRRASTAPTSSARRSAASASLVAAQPRRAARRPCCGSPCSPRRPACCLPGPARGPCVAGRRDRRGLFRRRWPILAALAAHRARQQPDRRHPARPSSRTASSTRHDIAFESWNSFSRITVGAELTGPPALCGARRRSSPHRHVEQRWMTHRRRRRHRHVPLQRRSARRSLSCATT